MSILKDLKTHTEEINGSVNETLANMRRPMIRQTSVFSMKTTGLYGSVYEDPRGLGMLRFALIVAVVLGLVLMAIGLFWLTGKIGIATKVPESVTALSESIERNIPAVVGLMGMSDADTVATLAANNTLYQTAVESSGVELVRLPSDMGLEELALDYSVGFSNLDIDELCRILKGCWFFTSNNIGSETLKVKYADFTSGSVPAALVAAVNEQGFSADGCQVLSSGVDDAGNNYQYGTYPIGDGAVYYWRVAACPIKDVYYNDDLPENGSYVGITVSETALMTVASEMEGNVAKT